MIKLIYKNCFSENRRIDFRYFLYKLRAFFYYGKSYYCNCCQKKFRKFLPKGHNLRLNAECPYCGSLERHRLLLFYLQKETDIFLKHLKVLHFSPERCIYNILKKLDLEYIDGDINPAMAINIVDVTNIQYPDNYFDIIICSHVLGHVPDENTAISELLRVINNNGFVLLMTLIDTSKEVTFENNQIKTNVEKLLNYGEPDLYRLHGMDFAEKLQRQGFYVSVIDYRKQLESHLLISHSLGDGKRELIFKCRKV